LVTIRDDGRRLILSWCKDRPQAPDRLQLAEDWAERWQLGASVGSELSELMDEAGF
jgi:hypothetical protein